MSVDQDALSPKGYRVSAGVIDRHPWPSVWRLFYHSLGGRLGDNRDWLAIETWADQIGNALRSPDAP